VSTPGHGKGEGPARNEFRDSGTKEIVGGAEVSVANGVLPFHYYFPKESIIKKEQLNESIALSLL
jgi:hypothetical protein